MSFLAQLRNDLSPTHQTLSLCYLFTIESITQTLQMGFYLTHLQQGQLFDVGKPYRLQREHLLHPPAFISQDDLLIVNKLLAIDARWLDLPQPMLCETDLPEILSAMLATNRCFIGAENKSWRRLSFADPVAIDIQWQRQAQGTLRLRWKSNVDIQLLNLSPEALLPIAYHCTQATLSFVTHSLSDSALLELKHSGQDLTVLNVDAFLQNKQAIWQGLKLPLPSVTALKEVSAVMVPVLCFDSVNTADQTHAGQDCVSIRFRYSSKRYCVEVAYVVDDCLFDYWDGEHVCRLKREVQLEQHYLDILRPFLASFTSSDNSSNIHNNVNYWTTSESDQWLTLLTDSRKVLGQHDFQFTFNASFYYHYVSADTWQLSISESDNSLNLQLSADLAGSSLNILDLLEQLHTFNCQQNTLKLADGRLLLLPAEKISAIMQEFGDLYHQPSGTLRLPRSQINRLESLCCQLPQSTQLDGAVDYLDVAKSLYQAPVLLEQMIEGVNAQLRPYQWLGVCWFAHLKRHHVNGLLADDMGLGKTLQTLTHLCVEKQQGQLQTPALIVAPTSLLHNWAAEISKFTPQLRFIIVHGHKRQQDWQQLSDYDILITSYQLIVNDLEHWQAQPLSWIILDEAQVIKNSRTQASQALRQIDSDYRLCLSGTPVENHLGELWSLFDFLMPGVLGGKKYFRDFYQKPIELQANATRLTHLQNRIAPFILRRTKEQVASDLPEKTEIYQYISLGDAQRELYERQKELAQCQLEQQLADTEHAGQQQMLLLTALMKLRQVCCDPALLGEVDIASAKRQHCIDMVQELVAENRAILIFSQFTRMLDLLAEDFERLNISTLQLTGKTRNRQQLVNQFQDGDVSVFLISLKAGGLGLNLTRSDTVIHYDPWWNSAAEQQASDRAHRIGQNNPVFVYKLISEDTIEEKIAALQARKAQLSQHINQQAQLSGEKFALNLEALMSLWQEEMAPDSNLKV